MKNRSLLVVLAILMVGMAAFYAYLRWNQAPESIVQKDTEHRLKANQLLEAFQTQAQEAQGLYLNRVLEINGLCQSVENQGDSLYFVFVGNQNGGSVLCQLEVAGPSLPQVGDLVRCKGVCTGFDDLTGGVSMDRCILLTQP
ncbi:MAG: OB-fold protein [Bacteroidia bacterium]|jgi:hypothetical protein